MEFSWPLQVAQRLINLSMSVLQNCETLSNARGSPATIVCFTNCNSPSFRVSASGSSRNKFIDSSCSLTSCCDICDCNNFAKAIGKFCWSLYILCGISGLSWDYDFRRLNSSITSNTCKHKTGSIDHILHKPTHNKVFPAPGHASSTVSRSGTHRPGIWTCHSPTGKNCSQLILTYSCIFLQLSPKNKLEKISLFWNPGLKFRSKEKQMHCFAFQEDPCSQGYNCYDFMPGIN